ncbi:hypothetical protein MRB53_023265 [Persea americana]|uniref:Uncharacterized protein n=1 Tax=Persea americana TaxID=3435 RepID=A0ACC2LA06_PERAE|nr:hypothetical protein MRB53_023265 [Persea americana]
MEDGDGAFTDGGDRPDHFQRNEAISAVADDNFLGEEDEDDYEDLYNDVNVGEGFHQSLRGNEEVGLQNDPPEDEKKIQPEVLIPRDGVGSNGNGSNVVKDETSEAVLERVQEPERGENEVGAKVAASGGGITVKLGQSSSRTPETQGRIGNSPAPQGVVELGQNLGKLGDVQGQFGSNNLQGFGRQGGFGGVNGGGAVGVGGAGGGGAGTVLFVGELHWWTTDAQLESELAKYGAVKEVKFFDEKASGKSKGYCQVEFHDPAAATACKEGMNGHVFNGRPCVVAFASPHTVRRMGEAQLNKNQAVASQTNPPQMRRGPGGGGDVGGGRGNSISTGGNYQNFGRGGGGGGWGRGMGGRGPMGQIRNRVGMGGRGLIGNGGFGQGNVGFGQGLGPAGQPPPLLPPQAMMGQGFDPTGYGAMGRMGGYGGFPAGPVPPFPAGVLPSFPAIGGVGLPGVAPHVNPAFFGRGMPPNGMGMMPGTGAEGQGIGMWPDPSMGGWGAEEQAGRTGDSSYGEDAASDHQYGEEGYERGAWSNSTKEKERAPERDMSGASERRYRDDRNHGWDRDAPKEKDSGPDHDWPERRHRDDRETGWDRERDRDRDRYREDRERHSDHHRYRDREMEHDDEWDRGRSSRTHSKSRMSQEEEQRRRSRDIEHGKRRRLLSE